MPRFSPPALLSVLRGNLPSQADGALCVSYSGGLDSTVLLHAAARLIVECPDYRVRAVHIDHQLHADSATWAAHCGRQAAALGVEFARLTVEVDRSSDQGPEAAAREARYRALRGTLRAGEVLLTAHHADDQLETILLALMRGAGARGLSAMSAVRPFGDGWLARPLLGFKRVALEDWARAERLQWLTDPSNENTDFDRNYLRHRVLPALQERWSTAAEGAARSAAHLSEAVGVLDEVAAADAATAAVASCLSVERLRALDPARRRNVLRYWIRLCGARAPSTRKLAAIEHDMLNARDDRVPRVDWDGTEMRRHRGLLYCGPIVAATELPREIAWDASRSVELPPPLGSLRLVEANAGGISLAALSLPLSIRFRAGGESLQPAGDAHHRKLKKLLQAAGILPWWRERVPLIFCGDRLVAVGDLWVAADFAAHGAEPAVRIEWQRRPPLISTGRATDGRTSRTTGAQTSRAIGAQTICAAGEATEQASARDLPEKIRRRTPDKKRGKKNPDVG